MMGIAFAFVAGTLGRGERLERTTRLTLFTASALAVGSSSCSRLSTGAIWGIGTRS